jgi:hypothetical protein
MMRKIGSALGPTINPGSLTVAERLRYGGYRRWEEVNAAVLALAKDGGRSKRSSVVSIIAGKLFVRSFKENGRTSLAPVGADWSCCCQY